MKEVTVTNITAGQKFVNNLFTWSMLLLCIYVSQGSTWWTLVTGVLFVLCLVSQVKKFTKDYQITLKSRADAVAWANSLPYDDK